jgi:hypothetical protein
MKKFVAFAAIIVAVLSFSSCRKDYTCTCKISGQVEETIPILKSKKSQAETFCKNIESANAADGYSCSID